jgi:hypothetical protein
LAVGRTRRLKEISKNVPVFVPELRLEVEAGRIPALAKTIKGDWTTLVQISLMTPKAGV